MQDVKILMSHRSKRRVEACRQHFGAWIQSLSNLKRLTPEQLCRRWSRWSAWLLFCPFGSQRKSTATAIWYQLALALALTLRDAGASSSGTFSERSFDKMTKVMAAQFRLPCSLLASQCRSCFAMSLLLVRLNESFIGKLGKISLPEALTCSIEQTVAAVNFFQTFLRQVTHDWLKFTRTLWKELKFGLFATEQFESWRENEENFCCSELGENAKTSETIFGISICCRIYSLTWGFFISPLFIFVTLPSL